MVVWPDPVSVVVVVLTLVEPLMTGSGSDTVKPPLVGPAVELILVAESTLEAPDCDEITTDAVLPTTRVAVLLSVVI